MADGHVGSTGVDEAVAAVLHHPGGRLGIVKAALRVSMACTGRIAGTHGSIELPAMMHCPEHLVIRTRGGEQRINGLHHGNGLRFQVHEVHRCLAEGQIESSVMPLDETLAIAATLDTGRRLPGRVGRARDARDDNGKDPVQLVLEPPWAQALHWLSTIDLQG